MLGKLVLNLEPAFMSFESDAKVRRLKYCRNDEIRDLLVDLNLLSPDLGLPRKDYVMNLWGDFPVDVLSRYGLAKHTFSAVLSRNAKEAIKLAAS